MNVDPSNYSVRRLTPDDAAAIPAITRRVNGLGYIHSEVYHPDLLLQMNRTGERVSVVALHDVAGVVGHYALERPDLGRFAETGEAMVLPEHQHHHLLDQMRLLLEQEAGRMELVGLFGNAVTHHVYSQKMEELFKAVPTGFRLGSTPASAHRLANFPQRVSLVTYFKYLRHPGPLRLHIPEHHHEIAGRVFKALGREVELSSETNTGPSQITIESGIESNEQQGSIKVRRGGAQTINELRSAAEAMLTRPGIEVVFVEIGLNDPAAIEACASLEQAGFFFCGIEPRNAEESDVLHMQKLRAPLDLTLVQTVDELARDLLAYIARERTRVSPNRS